MKKNVRRERKKSCHPENKFGIKGAVEPATLQSGKIGGKIGVPLLISSVSGQELGQISQVPSSDLDRELTLQQRVGESGRIQLGGSKKGEWESGPKREPGQTSGDVWVPAMAMGPKQGRLVRETAHETRINQRGKKDAESEGCAIAKRRKF